MCFPGSAYQVNITQQQEVEDTINQIVKDFGGRLDVFVANSGIVWSEGAAIDSSISHYRDVLSTNLDGVYYCARAAGQHWRRQVQEKTTVSGEPLTNFKNGSFVATASMSGHIVNVPHLQAAYNISKAGVIHLCKLGRAIYFRINDEEMLISLSAFRQISRRRMGWLCACQQRVTWLRGKWAHRECI
jgi:NAD(P)-dependent dehydrogenase (short-subunit alcohol dehydrogenase family)